MNIFKGVVSALFFLAHARTIFTSNVPTVNHPVDTFAISCGSSSRTFSRDGRAWLEDAGSISSSFHTLNGKSITSDALHQDAKTVDPTPYNKARISHHEFTYTFHVRPGQKFIRLHFFPAAYKGFEKSRSIFTVKAGKFTLLTNFSPAFEADASAEKAIVKEFCVNIKKNQALDIVFSPFVQQKSKDIYAFINGIEIVSMPAGLYFTRDSDLGAKVVGQKYKFYIDNDTALEMVKRLNIGGIFIPPVEDESMFRGWDSDFDSLSQTDSVPINRNVKIQYKGGLSYLAPMRVYQSAKTTRPENKLNKQNLSWRIFVDSGFRYLLRLHFCELEPAMMKVGDREFNIFINNEIAESNADLIKWGGGHGVALYRDFVVILEENSIRGKYNLVIFLEPKFMSNGKQTEAILNGLEIFKMSNPDNHLTSWSVVQHIQSPTSSLFTKQRRLPSFGRKNSIATILTVIITSLNIVVYYLRRLSERSSDERNTSSQCHQFSLDEIKSTTNNFHHEYLIGSGGFGKVYKGRVGSNGSTVVAIKRLRPDSKQGENEFWTEIEMLSKLQHENLVSLIGYCNESQELLLIYQYMSRGTLDDHLYKIAAKGTFHPPLSWDQRLKISIGAATGLWYLHEQQVIHRDVKSSNILIDENWVAKISDFGLSKMGPANESLRSHVSTDVKGTFGYLCPEYFLTQMLSFKSDVYAFGVVLFEMLTGRPAVNMGLPDDQHQLAAWATNCIRDGNVERIIDPTLLRQIAPACLTKYIEIAQSCLKKVPRERPSMLDVLRHLDSALVSQQRPDSEDIKEFGQIYNEGSTSRDDTTSLIAETIPSFTEDYISTSSNGNDSNISKSAQPGLQEENFSSTVPSKKRWNLFRYFQRSPKNFQKSPKNPQRSLVSQHGSGNFSFKEILVATNNFRNSLHINFSGTESICKGQTDDGKRIVVLRSYLEKKTPPIMLELESILGVSPSENHAPAASLIGYYADNHNVILMFDDIDLANSSLYSHLHNPVREPLSWKQRLMICIDAAKVHKCLVAVKIQFWNLTSADILLDESFSTKIDLFSAASKNSTNNGVLDSEYIRDEQTRDKAAVFSFGRILSEVLYPENWFKNPDAIAHQMMRSTDNNNILHIDPYLVGKISPESTKIYLEITSRCMHRLGRERPSFSEIVSMLEMALQLQEETEDNHDISTTSVNISFNEIIVATNNFSNSRLDVDVRGIQTVCKGQTSAGKRVVVLRSYFKERAPPTMQELQSILGVSPSGNHAPASSRVGYYVDKHMVILLFDDIDVENSSLHNHLYNPTSQRLSWKQRLMICIDVVRVHKCLMAVEMRFWNFTSANILLDENFVPKIDLYSAVEIRTNNLLLDSDHAYGKNSKEKAAVFSFGIILFEVLCPDNWFEKNPGTIAHHIMPSINNNYIPRVDPYLVGKISPEPTKMYLEITSRCLHHLGSQRPSFGEIMSMLEMVLQLQEDTEANQDIPEESDFTETMIRDFLNSTKIAP